MNVKQGKEKGMLYPRDEWGEVMQFLDGWCYGIAPSGATVCCGREDGVRAMLADPEGRTGNEGIDGIIELERQLRQKKEGENGRDGNTHEVKSTHKFRAIKSSNKRTRLASHLKYKPFNTRQVEVRKRVSYGKA